MHAIQNVCPSCGTNMQLLNEKMIEVTQSHAIVDFKKFGKKKKEENETQ